MTPQELRAEALIQEALQRGEIERDLPGKGKPLNLDAYFDTPAHLRMGFSVLKNADVAPPELEILKQIREIEHALAETKDADVRARLGLRLSELNAAYDFGMRRYRS